jgi:hypothetical protein
VFIWLIFSGFGIMYHEKSGNPNPHPYCLSNFVQPWFHHTNLSDVFCLPANETLIFLLKNNEPLL